LDVFSLLRIWDTEHNNGVLVYLLLADRAVEIVADRGLNAKVPAAVWQGICRQMEAAFREERFQQGMVAGVGAIAQLLVQHFADSGSRVNELPDVPVML
ncbi:MAG TPA: TPM domain-containing protein, partial [bacterium]|nr:TPM domain-containing protein [bacterium]